MKKLNKNLLSLNDFKLLKEIKILIKDEFNVEIKLDDENLLNEILNFSEKEEGFKIYEKFSELSIIQIPTEKSNISLKEENKETENKKPKFSLSSLFSKKPKIGDIIDGKRVKGTYRGKIVFDD